MLRKYTVLETQLVPKQRKRRGGRQAGRQAAVSRTVRDSCSSQGSSQTDKNSWQSLENWPGGTELGVTGPEHIHGVGGSAPACVSGGSWGRPKARQALSP